MSSGMVHGNGQQQMMWNENAGYGSAPVGLAAWVESHAFPVPPPPPEDVQEEPHAMRKVAALEVENCEMAGKMAGMEALLREREMEATDMKHQLLAYEHVLEGERRGEPLSKAELLKQVIALSAQLQELNRQKASAPPPVVGATDDSAPLPPPPGSSAAAAKPAEPAAPAPQAAAKGASPQQKFEDPVEPADQFEASDNGSGGDRQLAEQAQQQQAYGVQGAGYVAPPPVRLGKNTEPQTGFQSTLPSVSLQQAPGAYQQQQQQQQQMMMPGAYQQQQMMSGGGGADMLQQSQSMPRPMSNGAYRVPASPRAAGMGMGMVPASPRVGGMNMVPASPRVAAGYGMQQQHQQRVAVPASPRIAYNRVPQSPRTAMGGGGAMVPAGGAGMGMVPASPRVAASPFSQAGNPYFSQDRPMTSPSPNLMHRSSSVGLPGAAYGQTTPMGHSASFGGASMAHSGGYGQTAPMGHSASFSGTGLNPMTPSAASMAQGGFTGTNVTNMNAAEMYGGDITANGLSAVRGSLLTFSRAKNLQAKESILRHLDQMVEHGRVSPDEVVAGVMEKCTERMRMVPPPPRQTGGILANLAGKTKLKAAEEEFLKNAAVAEVGMLSSTVVAFEWAPSTSYLELLETVPDLITRRLLTLEFLNGIFGRCGKLAVAKVINELACLDSMISDGLLPSVRELSNCMVLVMVNTKRSVEWRRKWVLGKA